jgi:hypothetical protein
VFEDSMGTKKSEVSDPSHFTKFEKIRRNSKKIDRNAFDKRKEQDFFENTKIG